MLQGMATLHSTFPSRPHFSRLLGLTRSGRSKHPPSCTASLPRLLEDRYHLPLPKREASISGRLDQPPSPHYGRTARRQVEDVLFTPCDADDGNVQ